MQDVAIIDRFLDAFSRYIESGLGLLSGEVAFLSSTLVAIDMTLAGLFWAMGGEDVLQRLVKKTLYVGTFAFLIGNFNALAGVLFRSFAGLGLLASGSGVSLAKFLQPGRLARVGVDTAAPLLSQIGELTGFPEVMQNLDVIAVLFLAWFVLVLGFFILAVQLFVTLIEFKLTTLAGFVLVPFALWGRTAFLAEKVLGNVVSSGIKVLVLAVIVGIGSGLFVELQGAPAQPSIDYALSAMLGALALLGLGIFGPGIATGLVSGAPQLGAGAAAGTVMAAGAATIAAGAGATIAARSVVSAARLTPQIESAARSGWQEGRYGGGFGGGASGGFGGGAGNGAASCGASGFGGTQRASSSSGHSTPSSEEADGRRTPNGAPPWAKRVQPHRYLASATSSAAHTVRGSDARGSSNGPSLKDPSH